MLFGDLRPLDCSRRQSKISKQTQDAGEGGNHSEQSKILRIQQSGQDSKRTHTEQKIGRECRDSRRTATNCLLLQIFHRYSRQPRRRLVRLIARRRLFKLQQQFPAIESFGITAGSIALHSPQSHESEKCLRLKPALRALGLERVHEVTNLLLTHFVFDWHE